MEATYNYPMNECGSTTVATLADGRIVSVDRRYGAVLPYGDHADDCDQINKMGGRCTCGLLDGIDCEALLADARINGKFGPRPVARTPRVEIPNDDPHVCPRCGTYCCGDCGAR